jgi:HlyD family secretion protein
LSKLSRLLGGLVLVAALGAGAYYAYAYWLNNGSNVNYRFAKVERGPLQSVVSATGTLNPVTSVLVGSQVSGQIRELHVDFNSPVKKDQVIARLDPQSFELKVAQARADLDAARASFEVARSNVNQLRAELARVTVTLLDAERDAKRKRMLVEKSFIAASEADKAQATFEATREQANAVRAQIETAQAQVNNAAATIKQREAVLRQTQVDLERTIIRSPVDGIVVQRSVDAGQTVAASLQAPTLFTIAKDLSEMQVDTSVDEADVGRLRLGLGATFTVDAFPRRIFEGKIVQIRKAPLVQQNVVTYTVVISAANTDFTLLPGMTANVRVVVDARENVLKVPNAALRFRPTGAGDVGAKSGGSAKGAGGLPPAAAAAQQYRERVLKELSLTADQRTLVETALSDSRQKMIALRELADEADRRRQFERVRLETRSRISAALKPEQQVIFERITAETFGGRASTGRLWLLDETGKPKPIDVRLGLTDGSYTEIVTNELAEGTELVVAALSGEAKKRPGGGPPRMF